ncbi:hypothetical protein NDU88_002572 [Pleurodeles waltl]|uniref:Secreted protein n=1 Tax=Pleurodeles waltl TaxID=8319 RepID=A0AAV7TLK4_PLEWA|nr:hypothetical protein NDU88_002572 [Pleurodeles waltl]
MRCAAACALWSGGHATGGARCPPCESRQRPGPNERPDGVLWRQRILAEKRGGRPWGSAYQVMGSQRELSTHKERQQQQSLGGRAPAWTVAHRTPTEEPGFGGPLHHPPHGRER